MGNKRKNDTNKQYYSMFIKSMRNRDLFNYVILLKGDELHLVTELENIEQSISEILGLDQPITIEDFKRDWLGRVKIKDHQLLLVDTAGCNKIQDTGSKILWNRKTELFKKFIKEHTTPVCYT